jgi:hypothetical protein
MKIYAVIGYFSLSAVLVVGCAGNKEFRGVDALRRHPDWPRIRATAELEVAQREGNTLWSYDAYYAPKQHTNGVWCVVASGAYPANRYGDSMDMLIRDGGEVFSYSPRMSSHPE